LRVKDFPLCTLAQKDPGVYAASGRVGTEVFPGVNWRLPGADHLLTCAMDRTLPGTVIITSVTGVSEGFRLIGDKYLKLYDVFVININSILHLLILGLMGIFRIRSTVSTTFPVRVRELHWRNMQTV